MVSVTVHANRFGRTETFHHQVADTSATSVEALKDLYEGQVGVVLAIYDGSGQPLFQATNEIVAEAITIKVIKPQRRSQRRMHQGDG